MPHLDCAHEVTNLDRSPVEIPFDCFHAGSGSDFEKFNHGRPIERSPVGKMDDDARSAFYRGDFFKAAKLGGGLSESRSHSVVKLTNAPKARLRDDFSNRALRIKN